MFRWWSKCISATICRTASRNTLFSSARIGKMINVDRRHISSNAENREDLQRIADGDDLQEFNDNSDLLISNQDIIQVLSLACYSGLILQISLVVTHTCVNHRGVPLEILVLVANVYKFLVNMNIIPNSNPNPNPN